MKELLESKRLYRLKEILAPEGPIPISKSSWWANVRAGIYPSPVKISERVSAWKSEDILALIKSFEDNK
ncbi:transcriptional regulator [Agrobacterium tumefaciens]|uniref:helix-turn-helix transcriptional regulator n=1 Tax=Agrobacterium tumefaciens TaxID=358 RepID=UPI0021D21A9E|nr:transcriptional regulator [Agrobacterium tumefaciens]UXT64194.1 transcriptional regulator [Agrobacterium tumefaciens]